jgi:hypothetical protein
MCQRCKRSSPARPKILLKRLNRGFHLIRECDTMNDNIDLTSYPEGFDYIIEHLDFLPNDKDERTAFLSEMMWALLAEDGEF